MVGTGIGCPERRWVPWSWRHPRSGCTGLWALWSLWVGVPIHCSGMRQMIFLKIPFNSNNSLILRITNCQSCTIFTELHLLHTRPAFLMLQLQNLRLHLQWQHWCKRFWALSLSELSQGSSSKACITEMIQDAEPNQSLVEQICWDQEVWQVLPPNINTLDPKNRTWKSHC